MSTLILDELYDGIVFNQTFRIEKRTNLAHIRPWIYQHGTLQDGEFQIEILDGAEVLATRTLTASEVNATKTLTYAHGFIRFDFDSLQLNIPEGDTTKEYIIRMQMINHTTDTGNFIGIVRNWDLKIYDTYGDGVVNNQGPNDMVEPAGLELYFYKSI